MLIYAADDNMLENKKDKVVLYLIKLHAMETYGGVDV
jgi:hypothetical protein